MKVIINATNNGYSPEQCGRTMTVRDMIELLEQYDDDAKVYLSFDNGYTYGSIREEDLSED
jgi:hypothetical protein